MIVVYQLDTQHAQHSLLFSYATCPTCHSRTQNTLLVSRVPSALLIVAYYTTPPNSTTKISYITFLQARTAAMLHNQTAPCFSQLHTSWLVSTQDRSQDMCIMSYVSCHTASIMSRRKYHIRSHVSCHIERIMSHRKYHVISHVSYHFASHVSCRIASTTSRRTYHVISHVSYHVASHVSCYVARIMSHRKYHVTSHVSCHNRRRTKNHKRSAQQQAGPRSPPPNQPTRSRVLGGLFVLIIDPSVAQ
jgi:hypothetical protein